MAVKTRGRKPKEEVEMMRKNIHRRPDFLENLPSRGVKASAIAKLAEKLKYCDSNEAVVYTIDEFKERFNTKVDIKQELNYIKSQLKFVYLKKMLRVHVDIEMQRVYFWEAAIKQLRDKE